MDEEEQEAPQATHRLEEIMVDSVGLVSRGANNATFLIIKSQQEAPMPDDELEI